MKQVLLLIIILFSPFLLFNSCKKNPAGPEDKPHVFVTGNTIGLSAMWTVFDSVILKVNRAAGDTIRTSPYTYRLCRTEETTGITADRFFSLSVKDTAITDNNNGAGLKQGTVYLYKISGYRDSSKILDTSLTLSVKTLKPGSRNIEWVVDSLPGGSGLLDIWGLNENDLWAVGGAKLSDGGSNVIRWNGIKWYSAPVLEAPPQGIYGFSNTNIWVVGHGYFQYGSIHNWDGSKWNRYKGLPPETEEDTIFVLHSVWGSKPNDVWAVGDSGTIVHWNGTDWRKVPGIDKKCRFRSVCGDITGNVYAAGINYSTWDWFLYLYNGRTWTKMVLGKNYAPTTTVWAAPNGDVYISGSYPMKISNGNYELIALPGRRSEQSAMRGSDINNIFSAGHYSEVYQNDGSTWKKMDTLYNYPNGALLSNLIVFEKSVFFVGLTSGQPIVIRGYIK